MRTIDELEERSRKFEGIHVRKDELIRLIAIARAAKDARDAYLDTDEINQAVEEAMKDGLFGNTAAMGGVHDHV